MPSPISFSNPGEIDPRLITTLGCNVKEGDSPIGYFGTGLKYAIAVLLREGQQVTIWSGLTRYEFSLTTDTLRGKQFQFVTMNRAVLGFTTEYGKNWTVENSYRELFCNAKDEGGVVEVGPGAPRPGTTVVEVVGEKFAEAHRARWTFLLNPDRVPLYSSHLGEIYSGASPKIFYRGVAAAGCYADLATRYTYNLLEKQPLTEDRTLAHEWNTRSAMAKLLAQCEDEHILRDTLRDELGAEKYFHFSYSEPKEKFYEVVMELSHSHRDSMNKNALEFVWNKRGKPKPNWRRIELTAEEREKLQGALRFWSRVGFEIGNYQIHLVASISESSNSKVLACAEDEQIWLTPECFSGEELLRVALLEEYIHLRSRVGDETREMQNVLFAELHRVVGLTHGR